MRHALPCLHWTSSYDDPTHSLHHPEGPDPDLADVEGHQTLVLRGSVPVPVRIRLGVRGVPVPDTTVSIHVGLRWGEEKISVFAAKWVQWRSTPVSTGLHPMMILKATPILITVPRSMSESTSDVWPMFPKQSWKTALSIPRTHHHCSWIWPEPLSNSGSLLRIRLNCSRADSAASGLPPLQPLDYLL